MRNYFSRSHSSRLSTANPFSEKQYHSETRPLNTSDGHSDDGDSALVDIPAVLTPPNLKIKRVDHFWSTWSKGWKYRNTGSSVVAEAVRPVGNGTTNDPWQNFCFVVVRKFPQQQNDLEDEIKYKIVIKSPYLLKACKDVIGNVPGVSWTAEPLELEPQLLLAFFPQLEAHEKLLKGKTRSLHEDYILATLSVLLEYLRKDYRATLERIANLTTHGEITSELLYAILVPRTIIVTECPVTGETRALQLRALRQVKLGSGKASVVWRLLCESIDSLEEAIHGRNVESNINGRAPQQANHSSGANPRASGIGEKSFGRVETVIYIEPFSGTKKINTLAAYPLKYSYDPQGLREMLLERGRKWASLKGIHHVHYQGTAAFRLGTASCQTIVKYNVDSRIMVDRRNFLRLNPNYARPKASETEQNDRAQEAYNPNDRLRAHRQQMMNDEPDHFENVFTLDVRSKTHAEEAALKDEDLLLASPILYGYSLSDKIWLEFNVQHIQPIVWNEEAFANLVLADDRKDLLRSLVDAHSVDLGFDDFVQGKGQGLIINLFGPPGVGKTLSAEATSERVHRPLYVVGGGDLGTKASDVDAELTRVFDIATSWKAIVLIDEADVFLERRSLHDLERNAMVAVFLRHVEYYRGILFLTTNRITAFDPAFLSRIHVALHFGELSLAARTQVWRAFLRKAGIAAPAPGVDAEAQFVARLAAREVNGRQIKNACRTAQSLAHSRGQQLAVEHLEETLDAMEDFNIEFAAMTKAQARGSD
ncbi:P-loop containing nucleoside triphosphate hydrolase protein [Trametes versicolor FP-101664 SS1]|uniref:P-loop containing nucleoside triphosphate hydrolase protein n=1 Tax=Trametes versicolor (strain FP-101664) TaxID=717944 RepID=UPI0004621663|nr:P-loop containing nucleoside triphosphate hydrolase protein [Trametes versicolor FP-101664 SS1]EIW53206.1 P-loop containing nucleoside triphosphate hydrolase protein [Trametes versicolor FP-101664 SS1]